MCVKGSGKERRGPGNREARGKHRVLVGGSKGDGCPFSTSSPSSWVSVCVSPCPGVEPSVCR